MIGGKEDETKRDYEERLNELGAPEDDKRSNGGRVPDNCKYGSWLRRNDPIAFQVGFNEWQQNTSQRRGKTPAERSKKMKMDDFLTLDDLMVIAGVDGEPRAAYREDEVLVTNMPFRVEPGDKFLLEYDDGRDNKKVEVKIEF